MYYITSKKDDLSGPTWQSLHSYFELGWEVTTTHFDAKRLMANGTIGANDVIVTLRGREFLYSKLAKVMAWEDFVLTREIPDASKAKFLPDVTDLTVIYADTALPTADYYHGPEKRYRWEKEIKTYLISLDTPAVGTLAATPFALACWRYRHNHVATRNTPEATARTINDFLLEKYGQVYVVGHECEKLCDGKKTVHVDLPTFAGLCLSPNCKLVVGAMTGTMQLAAVLTQGSLAVYQHNPPEAVNHSNHPCVMGECVNVWRNRRMVHYQPVTPLPEFMGKLKEFAP